MTRLIDADELITALSVSAAGVRTTIRHMPTVDAVPVKHGKWIDETFKPWGLVHHPFKCNLCGERAEYASPYCPNCGARMVKDDQID